VINRADDAKVLLISRLGGLDAHMAQAAGIAHDLGHPPFGHISEKVLDELGIAEGVVDGFEGNAQSFRVLTQIARWDPKSPFRGLRNMTRGTFAAVLKYPWLRPSSRPGEQDSARELLKWRKYGAYRSEADLFDEARSWVQRSLLPETPTLEASVMDLADEITYAVHDLYDFVSYGLIDIKDSLERLGDDWQVFNAEERRTLAAEHPGYFSEEELAEAHKWLEGQVQIVDRFIPQITSPKLPEKPFARLSSDLFDLFVSSVRVQEEPYWEGGPHLSLGRKDFHHLYVLKEYTLKEALRIPAIAAQQRAATPLVQDLGEQLFKWSKDDPDSLPKDLRTRLLAADRGDDPISKAIASLPGIRSADDPDTSGLGCPARLVLDYIAGLTDHSARSFYSAVTPSGMTPIGRHAFL
jgi:dGTPase